MIPDPQNTPRKTVPVAVQGIGIIQVAPGEFARKVADLPPDLAPAAGTVRWQAVGDGTFKPVVVIHDQYVKLIRAALHFGVVEQALRRLITAGFVKGRQPSPRAWQVEITSLSNHLRAVETDPEFWTPARVQKFSEAI